MEAGKNRDWSALPSKLLVSVAEHLRLADVARIPAVCGCWAWALGWAKRGRPPTPVLSAIFAPVENSSPWLLLPNDDGVDSQYRDFLRLSESQSRSGGGVPRMRISPLPEMASRICVGGSPDGWIATVDIWLKPKLLNPLTREEFPLPSLFTLYPYSTMTPVYSDDGSMRMISCDHPGVYDISFERFKFKFVRKIILSSAPPFGIAFIIFGHCSSISHLAMARVGDLTWTPALESEKFRFYDISDIVFNKNDNKFYAVSFGGRIVVLDLKDYHWGSSKTAKATLLSSVKLMCPEISLDGINYLVFSSSGDLLQVWRQYKPYFDFIEEKCFTLRKETHFIKIFKFDSGHCDWKEPNSSWVQVKDLGDDAMFLGLSHSTCVTTIDKPWLKRNSVYFAEDVFRNRNFALRDYTCDGGIFCLRDNKVERLFFPNYSKVNWPLPAWFTPSRLQFVL